jgi:hypothetical protein
VREHPWQKAQGLLAKTFSRSRGDHYPSRSQKEEWTQAWKQLEERVRQGPRQHLLMALVIGYVLQIIPVRSLLGLALKLCLILVRPVLFLACAFPPAKYLSKGSNSGGVSQ